MHYLVSIFKSLRAKNRESGEAKQRYLVNKWVWKAISILAYMCMEGAPIQRSYHGFTNMLLLSRSHLHLFSACSHTDSRGETADANAFIDHEHSPCFSLKCLSCICGVLLNCFNLKSLSASSCLLHGTNRWQFGSFTTFVGSPLWSAVVAWCGCRASSDGTVVRMKLQSWNTFKHLSWADFRPMADIL